MGMQMHLMFMLMGVLVLCNLLSAHGSADDASFLAASPSAQRHRKPLGSHSNKLPHFPAIKHEPPTKAPILPKFSKPSSISVAPSVSSFQGPVKKWIDGYAHVPSMSSHKRHHHGRNHFSDFAPQHSPFPRHIYHRAGPSISPVQSPFPISRRSPSPAPAPSPAVLSSQSSSM